MEKKYQVFISSTYQDLIDERKGVQDTLLSANCIPAGMESFVATDDEQFNVIKRVIDLCDYYVLIIGGRYGSINEATGLSYTEMEYDYAVSKNIPVLVFAIDNVDKLCEDYKETEESKIEGLLNFRNKALKNRMAKIWSDKSDLKEKVALSIMTAQKDNERPGWIRAGKYDNKELLENIHELRMENDSLKEQIRKLIAINSEEPKYDNLSFENETITFNVEDYFGPNHTVDTSLEEVFVLFSSKLSDGEFGIDDCQKVLDKAFCSTEEEINDDVTILKCLIQFKALGFISKTANGYIMTKKGEQKLEKLLLIKK